jgi:hypothetical protein
VKLLVPHHALCGFASNKNVPGKKQKHIQLIIPISHRHGHHKSLIPCHSSRSSPRNSDRLMSWWDLQTSISNGWGLWAPYCQRYETNESMDGTVEATDKSIFKCLALKIILHPNEQTKTHCLDWCLAILMFAKFPMVFESHHHSKKGHYILYIYIWL